MVIKLLVAGAIGAALFYAFHGMVQPSCSNATTSTGAELLTGFGIGAGVQAGVMLLGVS